MTMAAQENNNGNPHELIPTLLHHTCLTVIDKGEGTLGPDPRVYVLGTHSTIKAAKAFALEALSTLGYDKDSFKVYRENIQDPESWEHGDGIVVYAKTPAGHDFLVGIDTKPNTENIPAKADGSLILPHGTDHLHYVLQTTIDYKGNPAVFTEIQGAFAKRSDALEAAKKCLVTGYGSKIEYDQYDERDSIEMPESWPYGEDVFAHAVACTGESYLVSLKTPPQTYLPLKHRK